MQDSSSRGGSFIDEEIDLSQYWAVIRRNKWSILSLAMLVSFLTVLIVYSITPVYKATASLLIESQQPKLPSIESIYGLAGKDKQYYLTQLQVLNSRRLAEQVIAEMKLDTSPEFLPKEGGFISIGSLKSWVSTQLALLLHGDEETEVVEDHTLDLVVEDFQGRLTSALVKDTQVITLTFESESPAQAAAVANALANVYIDDQLAWRVDKTRKATRWMEQRLKVLKQKLKNSEQLLQSYKEKHGLIDVHGVNTLAAQELDELGTQLITARSKYNETSKRYGSMHPRLIAARSELRQAKNALARGKAKLQNISRKAVKLREFERQVESNKQLYDTFLSSLKEANQAIDLQAGNARISDLAVAPLEPFKPEKGLIVALAFFTSLMLGVLLAFLTEALDKTFKGTSDLEEKLGQPILGLLPIIKANIKNRKAHVFAMLDENETAFAEAMRTIRTGLILSGLDNPHKVILVTSSVPGEGKTTVCTNLAAAMAKMEKVLLLGGDLRRPSLSSAIGIDDKHGLSDFIAGTSNFNDCIHHLENEGFDLLPCGLLPPNPLELLSSERFGKMLELLETHYDRIVIDSPPLQVVSDALVLSKYAKAVVFVVAAESTHEHIVKNGIKRLLQHDAPLVGIILNKFDVDKSDKYGYEYGGYYDHYGYSDKT